ncbi:probable Kinesin-like protein KIF9 at N-terminal half [Coccomyxa sp. Obi]|nr:probable Kinesin-like protein KIF9 at N-terminal half [Coccomyxa sp. Obi]
MVLVSGPPSRELLQDENEGIMPRAIKQMFSELERSDLIQWSVSVSYVEIYNETFRDLCDTSTSPSDITIYEQQGVVALNNVQRIKCSTAAAALDVLAMGQSNRAIAGHALNSRSSRSHAIFTLWCETIQPDGQTYLSKFNMVDLAGSERSSKTGTEGAIAKEALHINKSLSFLEQVIVGLSRKDTKHVPYRSSKLTHFLKDSIGGNCQTRLIACIWSDPAQINETLSTCRFAQRMMKVAVEARRNGNGVSAVHGNLLKLDPALQQYLTQMTEAAVARERAKLHAEVKENLLRQAASQDREELDLLRTRHASPALLFRISASVLALQAQLESRGDPRSAGGDADTAAELAELRAMVSQLQGSGRPSSGAETDRLLSEIKLLRQQVQEMSSEELGHASSQGPSSVGPASPRSAASVTTGGRASSTASTSPADPAALDGASVGLGRTDTHCSASSCPPTLTAADAEETQRLKERVHELEAAERRLKQLEAINAGQESGSEYKNQCTLPPGLAVRRPPRSTSGESFTSTQDWSGNQQAPGLLQRMFSKSIKRNEHPSFVGFPKRESRAAATAEEEAVPNIVILNSLTHDQLVDLLKVRGTTSS